MGGPFKYGIFVLVPILTGCRADFDVTANYEEIPVVYGLLDIQDSVHHIRIQRAYLDKSTSALVLAQNPDSIYYPDVLDVYIQERSAKETIPLSRVTGAEVDLTKDPGVFASEAHVLYRFEHPLQTGLPYELHVHNRLTGKKVTASAKMVRPFTSYLPVGNYVVNWSGDTSDMAGFKWEVKEDAMVFDLSITFHYFKSPPGSTDSTLKKLTWSILPNRLANITAQEYFISYPYPTELFYINIANHLKPEPGVKRNAAKITFQLTAGGEALGKLIANQQVQNGITGSMALERYTNIDGGFGIFSSRYTMEFENIVGRTMRDSLRAGRYTHDLRFQ